MFTAFVWVAVLSGFGTDTFNHLSKYGLDYPLIVHFHAVAFVGYLALFTVQVALIRMARADIHRRLGLAGAALAAIMVVLGPATALVVDAGRFSATGRTPEFLAVQLTDILAFTGFTAAGLLLRARPAAHKRLMLLGLIYISDAGFARLLNGAVAAPLALGEWGELYLWSDKPSDSSTDRWMHEWIQCFNLGQSYLGGQSATCGVKRCDQSSRRSSSAQTI